MVHTHTTRDQEANMPPSRRKPTVKAKGITVTPLGDDGLPSGPGVHMPDALATVGLDVTDVRPVEELYSPEELTAARGLTMQIDVVAGSALSELTRIPIPTAVIDRWFPAFVRWPGEDQPLVSCKVFATPQGLYVYTRRPDRPEGFSEGAKPQRWVSSIDFEKTGLPPVSSVARNAGFRIHTPAGVVIVQPTGSCGCGNRLKHWTPDWARNTISWQDGAKLAANAIAGR